MVFVLRKMTIAGHLLCLCGLYYVHERELAGAPRRCLFTYPSSARTFRAFREVLIGCGLRCPQARQEKRIQRVHPPISNAHIQVRSDKRWLNTAAKRWIGAKMPVKAPGMVTELCVGAAEPSR